MIRPVAICAVAGVFAGAACGGHRFVLPTGTGQPVAASEAAAAYGEATTACRDVTNYSARVRISHLSGSIDGIVTSADEIYLLYTVAGQTGFELQGTGGGATLVLPRDRRFVKARADEIVNALIGAPLTPRELLAALAGCGRPAGDAREGSRFGDLMAVSIAGRSVFLARPRGVWQVVAANAPGVLIDYQRFEGTWPRNVRLTVAAGDGTDVALSMTLDQVVVNRAVNPLAFVPRPLPEGASPMTLAELREMGPLRGRK